MTQVSTLSPHSPSSPSLEKGRQPLLSVRNLVKRFPITKGLLRRVVGHIHAVSDVSFEIGRGETYALVGESGCGKTTTGRVILRLIEPTEGEVEFEGHSVFSCDRKTLRSLRQRMQIIFQDPYSSLNPRMTVGAIIEEGLVIHQKGTPKERRERVASLLEEVGLRAEHASRYPHEFSGGQRQRIGIARALALEPSFVVCDEAVSALDVSVQAQVINLLQDLQERHGIAYLFIAHDLAVVRHMAHRVGVMYLGHLVEEAETDRLFAEPLHPYTQALLRAIPHPDPKRPKERKILEGDVPRADAPPPGCRFHTRCPVATEACKSGEIPTFSPEPGHRVKCLRFA